MEEKEKIISTKLQRRRRLSEIKSKEGTRSFIYESASRQNS